MTSVDGGGAAAKTDSIVMATILPIQLIWRALKIQTHRSDDSSLDESWILDVFFKLTN